jgi:hypothetical protein
MTAWDRLLAGYPWHRGAGAFPIAAYSEFLPPPRLGRLPYGTFRPGLPSRDDPWGWPVTEHEEAFELRPGLQHVATQLLGRLVRLYRGEANHGIARVMLEDNPYWPPQLAASAAQPARKGEPERFVTIVPLALSRTQDDKGRIRWTLFGGSDVGPARAFWRGFFSAEGRERPAEEALGFLRNLLVTAFGRARSGLRILPQGRLASPLPDWPEGPLPGWTRPLLWEEGQPLAGVRYLLTFRPFALLPEAIQRAYLAGRLALIPFPGCLLFWGAPLFLRLRHELPDALQIPLLWHVAHHDDPNGFRVPQSGWMHEPVPGGGGTPLTPALDVQEVLLHNTYRRTHRTARVLRDQPAGPSVSVSAREDRMAHVLFDASEAIGLYGKPMARNAQVWTHEGRLRLNGPTADPDQLEWAARQVGAGGLFGYRFVFPAMRVGTHEVLWHRPLVACLPAGAEHPIVVAGAPLGSLIATPAERPGSRNEPDAAIELWPRIQTRAPCVWAATLFTRTDDPRPLQTARNCRRFFDARALFEGQPLDRAFARRLLRAPEHQTL